MAQPREKTSPSNFVDARTAYTTTTKRQGFAANTNRASDYAPTYPTISGDFNETQYNRSGIQNVTVENGRSAGSASRYSDEQPARARRMSVRRAVRQQAYAPDEPANTNNQPRPERRIKMVPPVATPLPAIEAKVAKTSAAFHVATAMGWTGLLNTILFPIGIFAWVCFGVAAMLENVPGGEIGTAVVAWWYEVDDFNAWYIAIFGIAIYWFGVITMFALSYMQFRLGGLQPIAGKAHGLKTMSLVISFLAMAIPGANFIPWIYFWFFFVGRFPN